MDNQSQTPVPAFTNSPTQSQSTSGKKKIILWLIGGVVLVAAFGGVYYWQHSKVKDSNAKLESSSASLIKAQESLAKSQTQLKQTESKLKATTTTTKPEAVTDPTIDANLIPGQAETNRDDGRILITAVYNPANAPKEIWVDYGTSPEKLDKSTTHANKALGLSADNQTYTFGQSLEIPKSSVEAGASYFYRVSALTTGNKTVHGPTASFTTTK